MTARPIDVPATQREVIALIKGGRATEALDLARTLDPGALRDRLEIAALLKVGGMQEVAEAVEALERWSRRQPNEAQVFQRLVECHLYLDRLDRAGHWLRRLESVGGSTVDPSFFRAVIHQRSGDHRSAFGELLRSLERTRPGAAENRLEAAMQLCNIAGGYFPGSPGQSPSLMLDCHDEQSVLDEALNAWSGSDADCGGDSEARALAANGWYNLGSYAMADYDRADYSAACFERAYHLNPALLLACTNRSFVLNYSTRVSVEELYRMHVETGRRLTAAMAWPNQGPASEHRRVRDRDEPLRIAYLSSDFRSHSVAHFILPVLENHDRRRFHVTAYHDHAASDRLTGLVEAACDRFVPVHGLDDRALAAEIRRHGIEVLIELNGMTANHRMTLMCGRHAPLQLSWIGYPNTTGLETVDYRIVDRVTDPPDSASERMVEEPMVLPRVFSVYRPPDDLPVPGVPPLAANGYVTFGSFNYLPKINPGVIDMWAEILECVPGSRLLIKNGALDAGRPKRMLAQALAGHGIDPARVRFEGRTPSSREHLGWYREVDIALDTFPYNGTTTTCDSLIMGVPVVTRFGKDHRSRVGLSQLTAIGLECLASGSRSGYIETAACLANDPGRVTEYRDTLRGRVLASSLTDAPGLVSDLEEAIGSAWESRSDAPA